MSSSRVPVTMALLAAVLLLALLGVAKGQNYHYSNGWHPGKRAGLFNEALLSGLNDDQCRFKPRILNFITQLITEELARVERSCSTAHTVSHLKRLFETPLQRAEAREKLQEEVEEAEREDNKW